MVIQTSTNQTAQSITPAPLPPLFISIIKNKFIKVLLKILYK